MNASLADSKIFWLLCNALLLLLHVIGIVQCLSSGLTHPMAMLWAIILAIHVLELPLAFVLLRNRPATGPRWTTLMTLLFGFTWWIPARRGLWHT